MKLDVSGVADDFPSFRVAVVVAAGLEIGETRPAELDRLIAEREAAARERWSGLELAEIPGIAAWRKAYRAFGIKRTSYRSSVERLLKNVLAGRSLPVINGFVDAYNAVSLAHVLPIGADDLDGVIGDFAFRYAKEGDSFQDMGADEDENGYPESPPKAGEVVYADARKVLCRRWNWRQDARSLVTTRTTRAVVTLQSNGWGDVAAAADDLVTLLARFCAASCAVSLADAGQRRVVDLNFP